MFWLTEKILDSKEEGTYKMARINETKELEETKEREIRI